VLVVALDTMVGSAFAVFAVIEIEILRECRLVEFLRLCVVVDVDAFAFAAAFKTKLDLLLL
jgi:hypothetical protein